MNTVIDKVLFVTDEQNIRLTDYSVIAVYCVHFAGTGHKKKECTDSKIQCMGAHTLCLIQ